MTPEQAEKYVQWNQCTRHQLIVAHMLLVEETDKATKALMSALGNPYHDSLPGAVAAAVEQLMQKPQGRK